MALEKGDTLEQITALEAIARTRGLADLIAEEKYGSPKEMARILQAERDKTDAELDRRLTKFLFCFGNEWNQIVFQTLCYFPKKVNKGELRKKVKQAIGEKNYCPDTFRSYLLNFCDNGFAVKEKIDGRDYYYPTQIGREYGLPGVIRLLGWEIKNKISSNVFIGLAQSSNGNSERSNRIKILELLTKNQDREVSIAWLSKKVKADRSNIRKQILILEGNGLVHFESVTHGEKYGGKRWIGKTADIKKAKEDPRLKIYPSRIKPLIISALSNSMSEMNYTDVAQRINYVGDPSPISSFLMTLCRYGYASSRWEGCEKKSRVSILDKGRDYVKMLEEIKRGSLDYGAFAFKESYKDFEKKAKIAAAIYFPHSRTHRVYLKVLPKVIGYLRDNGETNAIELYKNTPVKDALLLNRAVQEKILKKRKIRRHGWRVEVKYSLV